MTERLRGTSSPLAVLGILISIAAMWLALRQVDFGEFRSALGSAELPLLALGVLGVLASYPLLGLRWRTVGRGVGKMPRRDAIEWVLIGAAANNVLPTRIGEFVRAFGHHRCARVPYMSALGVVVVDRSADLLLFGLSLAATVWLAEDVGWVQWIAGLSGGVILLLVLGLLGIALWMRDRPQPAEDSSRLKRYFHSAAVGLGALRHPRQFVVALCFTFAAWGVVILGALAVSSSLGISVSLPEMIFTIAVIGLGTALPSAPGFVGTYHWLAASSLVLFGAEPSVALAFAVVLHAAWYVPVTVGGVGLAARHGVTIASLNRARHAGELSAT